MKEANNKVSRGEYNGDKTIDTSTIGFLRLKYEGELMIEGQGWGLGLKVGVAKTIEGKGVVLQWQCLSV